MQREQGLGKESFSGSGQEGDMEVIVVGGGLSGLTAARSILKSRPGTRLTLLEASDYLGGRTQSIELKGCTFDLGAEFIGRSQEHVIELAHEAGNELVSVDGEGRKVLQFKDGISTYTSTIPNNVNILALLQLQLTIMKIDRMASKVCPINPSKCPLAAKWDSQTLQSWLQRHIWFDKLRLMVEGAVRVILGVQLCEVSVLYFLWYTRQSGGFEKLISVENGLQEKKTSLGTQQLSIFLGEQVKAAGGIIKLGFKVAEISQDEQGCSVVSQEGERIRGKWMVIAMPPCQVNKLQFQPRLSQERRLICDRSFMGALIKVIILYDRQYWKEAGFSGQTLSDCFDSPAMNGFDDSRINHEGKLQPALIVFVGGALLRTWSTREDFTSSLLNKLAAYFKEPKMKEPLEVKWKDWQTHGPIGGAPVSPFSPGLLSQAHHLRKPQGRIHWAGTELARVSTGFMDGAIQSGKRAASEILLRLKGEKLPEQIEATKPAYLSYNVEPTKKWFEWW